MPKKSEAEREVQRMLDRGEVTEQQVQIIRQVAKSVGTFGVEQIVADAWDESAGTWKE